MGKTAFLFSGQGAQRAGMGKEFYEHFASVRALFDAAEELRPGTLQQMFAGSDDELRQTENTQPCLYLADLAAAYALRDSGLQPEAVAGFSLGEIPALAFAGAYDGMTGFRLACARGASMARAGRNVNASMSSCRTRRSSASAPPMTMSGRSITTATGRSPSRATGMSWSACMPMSRLRAAAACR